MTGGALPNGRLSGIVTADDRRNLIIEVALDHDELLTVAVPLTGWQADYLVKKLQESYDQ
jgi:hypothetical protein